MMRVAPETQYKGDFNSDVWLLNLDMIEQNTGIVIDKVMVSIDTVKGSVFTFDKDYVLYSKLRPYLNKVVLPDDRGFATSELIPLKPDINLLNRVFLACLLRSDQFVEYATKLSGGSRMPRVPMKEFRNFPCILPPINLQNQFAAFVQQVDKSKFVCYSNFKSQFIEMFGDPLENPFGWEQVTLKDISKGKLSYGSGASATTYDGKTRYVRITDITDSGELNDDIKSPSIYEAIHALNEGDILFARSGATVGKTYCHNEKYGKCIYAGYLIRLIPDKEKVLPEYVFHYTKTDYYNNFVAINKRTVAQPNINAKQYGDLVICVPPLEIQNRFVELIHQTDKSKLSEHVTYNSLGDMLVNLNLFRR
ncbi:restriction endonuclease S subunit [Schinkia azotoformans MEV2011]|uniref:Restriction endonuclease S subunit n=1 Tax=Schinkia azotoformans MEV2011 TaxID=1348973 RepID=A0A072NG79_SCHAZ|nr:restriction endonuclease subunit S [Schinkia azotoformans]KEF35938.1 restriction endonuclease S subunit [Schinkia azotoformans MEV2011]MEC1743042.1 restriction endonuclease subunit S [Schinkia azotoformans]MED4419295.1 restriction endonuclease subunit S [Schinkia azotoformans]